MKNSLVAGCLLAVTLGCSGSERSARPRQSIANRDTALKLGPGDVQIATTDSSMELALVGQRILVRFGERTREQIRRETDTNTVHDSGFGGSIERLVKSTVASALDKQIEYPLTDVREASYENGEIRLETNRGRLLERTQVHGKPLSRSFAPQDAQRFVAAVQARKAGKKG
jgi:hypothetical protein